MASQFNVVPNFPVPLVTNRETTKDWYFFFTGLYRGLPPAQVMPVTVGASPFTFSAPTKGSLIVQGGTVSAIAFTRDGVTFYTVGQTSGMFTLNASDQMRVTYSVLPTITFIPT